MASSGDGVRVSAAAAAARLDEQLRGVFGSFARFGQDRAHSREAQQAQAQQEPSLDCAGFQKLCRDCRLLDPLVTKESVDVVFAKAKGAPRNRRLTFAHFRHALVLLAEVKYGANPDGPFAVASHVVASALSAGGGPQLDAVHLPETSHTVFQKLTDASLYTSSHKLRFDADGRGRGKDGRDRVTVGRGTVDLYSGGNVVDLSSIVRPGFRGATHMSNFARTSSAALSAASVVVSPGAAAAAASFAAANGGAEGGASTSSPLAGRGQWGSPGARRVQSAAPERVSPSHSQDSADARPPTAAMPQWRMRTEGAGAGSAGSPSGQAPGGGSDGGGGAVVSGSGLSGGLNAGGRLQPPKVAIESTELENVFLAYCAFGTTVRMVEELDSSRFMKFCRETHLIDGRGVTPATVDLVFAKAKAAASAADGGSAASRGKRTIGYGDFCQALAALALLRHPGSELLPALQAVVETAILAGGPAVSTVSLLPATGSVHERLADRRFFTASAALRESESRSPR
jgi:hypothetical protein